MSGLLALLDDVAAIAKMAAASVDDIAGQAAKAGAKAAGAVIDDTAVTPQFVQGLAAKRELPVVGRIALGSLRNKLVFLLPLALALTAFAPWLISPLLMLGGAYLCFEGAEKVTHWLLPGKGTGTGTPQEDDPAHLEEAKIRGAIKTDFILSAEIMTIALAAIESTSLWLTAATLAMVGVGITVLVYGSVALIVKADDLGYLMARRGRFRFGRWLGRRLVAIMPGFMAALLVVGTAAMLWVGGSIVLHGAEVLGWSAPAHLIESWAEKAAQSVPEQVREAVQWGARAMLDAVFGLALGLVLLPVGQKLIAPVWSAARGVFNNAKG